MLAETASLARLGQFGMHAFERAAGNQIQHEFGNAVRIDLRAQVRGQGIDQAALDAVRCGHAFALQCMLHAVAVLPVRNDRFQRRTCMTLHEVRTPIDIEAAVGRHQGRYRDPASLQ